MTATDLPPALDGSSHVLDSAHGRVHFYAAGAPQAPPLLLLHSINAAASAYDVRPLFAHYAHTHRVYAPELPGFGRSERRARLYTPRVMTDALLAVLRALRELHGARPLDALAVSLGSEFLARAAVEMPAAFRSVALVSPTGFNSMTPASGAPGSDRGMPWLRNALAGKPWSRGLFNLLTSRPSVRFFLVKTFGRRAIDEGLFEYCVRSAREPGAEHAPYSFVSGFLFSRDIRQVYAALRVPVWMCHGTRGDFVDYRHKRDFEGRPGWHFTVFDSGAMPYFEDLDGFVRAYDAFRARVPEPLPAETLAV